MMGWFRTVPNLSTGIDRLSLRRPYSPSANPKQTIIARPSQLRFQPGRRDGPTKSNAAAPTTRLVKIAMIRSRRRARKLRQLQRVPNIC